MPTAPSTTTSTEPSSPSTSPEFRPGSSDRGRFAWPRHLHRRQQQPRDRRGWHRPGHSGRGSDGMPTPYARRPQPRRYPAAESPPLPDASSPRIWRGSSRVTSRGPAHPSLWSTTLRTGSLPNRLTTLNLLCPARQASERGRRPLPTNCPAPPVVEPFTRTVGKVPTADEFADLRPTALQAEWRSDTPQIRSEGSMIPVSRNRRRPAPRFLPTSLTRGCRVRGRRARCARTGWWSARCRSPR